MVSESPSIHCPEKEASPPSYSIAFVGCGAVGRSLGRLLKDAGHTIAGVCCRTRESASRACAFIGAGDPAPAGEAKAVAASASVILIATADREIPDAEAAAAEGMGPGQVAVHLSGAQPSSLLSRCRMRGAAVGSMHPLQSFADPEAALKTVPGSVFACEGDEGAVAASFRMAESVGGKPIRIDTAAKPLYHAAASAASNFLIAPLLLALDLMEAAGLDRGTGMKALEPLIKGTVANTALKGVPEALTGPIERGDGVVIEGHLRAMDAACPGLKEHYLSLALMTVKAARRKGALSEEEAEELESLLDRHR